MKLLLLICASITCLYSVAQNSDFFIMKKSGKTIKSFYQGSYISFTTKDDENYEGYIKKVARDSVWVEFREVLRGFTDIGSVLLDTITYEARRFAVNDIRYITKDNKGFAAVSLSGLMKVGAAGYSVLHVVNSLVLHQKIDLKNIGIASGIYFAGVLIRNLHKDYYYIGKKYRLQYISLP